MHTGFIARLLLFAPLAFATLAAAQTQANQSDLAFLTARAFRAGVAEPDVILLNPTSGELSIGAAIPGSPDFDWTSYPGNRFHPLNPDSLRTADLNGDGTDDLILSSFRANRIGVIWGEADLNVTPRNDEFVLGAGPAGAEPITLPTAPDQLATALVAGSNPRLSIFELPGSRVSGTTALDPSTSLGFHHATASVPPTDQAGELTQFLAVATTYLDDSGVEPSPSTGIELFSAGVGSAAPSGPLRYEQVTLKRGYTSNLDAGHLTGEDALPWFIVWEPGNPVMDVGDGDTWLRVMQVPPPESVSMKKDGTITVSGMDITIIGHDQGQRAGIYDFNPATGFQLREMLIPPPGERFASILAIAEDRLFASMRPGGAGYLEDSMSNGASVPYAVYEDAGNGFRIVAQGNSPLFSKVAAHATIALFTDDPISGGGFEFETFLTGDWARNASLAAGQIHVTRESYLGSVRGLGNPMAVQLSPTNDPGPTAAVLANQFGDSGSSLFFKGAVTADGNATVSISPPAGSYNSPVEVTFAAPAGTSVTYRINGQSWQSANAGGFFVSADTVIDYYGQAPSGALGSLQTAAYDIELSFASDANHDFLPDAIAVSLGLDPFGDGDADGDGFTNAEEVFNGSDPTSPNSVPGVVSVLVLPPLSFEMRVSIPAPGGGLADTPATRGDIRVYSPVEGGVSRAVVAPDGIATIMIDDYYGKKDSRLLHARSGHLFHDALITELTLPIPEGAAPMMLGFAMPSGTDLPLPPAPASSPVPIPYPTAAQRAQWIDDVVASLAAFPEARGIDPSTNMIAITPDTTLALAAFTAWISQQFAPAGEPAVKVKFPWISDAAARAITRADLATLEEPQDTRLLAHELTHVVQQLHAEIVTNPDYLPLRNAVREMILFATDQNRPVVLGQIWNAPEVIIEFFDTGLMDSLYSGVVTASPATLALLRDQLLAAPQSRLVLDFDATLVLLPNGSWAARDASAEIHPLRGRTLVSEVENGTVSYRLRPADLALYNNTGFLPGMSVHITGFPASQGDPLDVELLAISIINANLRGGIVDTDGDHMDDGFEQRFLNGLASGFWDDSDHDGFADGEEYLALTDPGDATSTPPGRPAFPRNLTISIDNDEVILGWTGGTQATYAVQYGLATGWQDSTFSPAHLGNGTFEWRTLLDAIPADAFRVMVTLE